VSLSFAPLGLADSLLQAIADRSYSTPTPIQARAIPEVLAGRDVLAAAQTGTGKTAAFTLPLLQRLAAKPAANPRRIRALVLVPTRELAAQVDQSIRTYGRHLPQLKTALIFGGVGINPQIDLLRRGVDIVIATPGRLLDHAGQGTLNLSAVEILVLDEADRMLDMGFIHDIRRVLKLLPATRQNLLFSATFNNDIRKLAQGLLQHPVSIDVAPRNAPAELVEHRVYHVEPQGKEPLLCSLLRQDGWRQTLVFTRTKHGANKLAKQLERDGVRCLAIHGNKSQNARTAALADFKANRIEVLVATDIAARGLDIFQLPHVVNYELPHVPEDYVHRIGRTGRAGATGEAISLVSHDERDRLRAIERLLGRSIEVAQAPAGVARPHATRHSPAPRQPQPHGPASRHRHGHASKPHAQPHHAPRHHAEAKPSPGPAHAATTPLHAPHPGPGAAPGPAHAHPARANSHARMRRSQRQWRRG